MNNPNFFVKDNNGNFVAAKFLYYNDVPVSDPNFGKVPEQPLYDIKHNLLAAENPNGYLIVQPTIVFNTR